LERGKSAHTSSCLGASTLPSRSLTKARTSSCVTAWPGRSWMTAVTRSPHFSSGSPMTAQSGVLVVARHHQRSADYDLAALARPEQLPFVVRDRDQGERSGTPGR